MKKIEFYVEPRFILEFADIISGTIIKNSIIGTTDEDEVVVLVEFKEKDDGVINKLKEITEFYVHEDEKEN